MTSVWSQTHIMISETSNKKQLHNYWQKKYLTVGSRFWFENKTNFVSLIPQNDRIFIENCGIERSIYREIDSGCLKTGVIWHIIWCCDGFCNVTLMLFCRHHFHSRLCFPLLLFKIILDSRFWLWWMFSSKQLHD